MQPLNSNKAKPQRFPGYQDLLDQTKVIAQKEPNKASNLYWKILFCDGSRFAMTKLAREGLDVSRIKPYTGLLGGTRADMQRSVQESILGGIQGPLLPFSPPIKIEITIDVDRQWLSRQDRFENIPARAHLTDGSTTRGKYNGQERVLESKRSFLGVVKERFSIAPHGTGTFFCDDFMYSGDFINGAFHDLSGQAYLHMITMRSRYTGCFENGSMNGPGLFELIDDETEDFYTCIKGVFKENKPFDGSVYSITGEAIGKYVNGVYEDTQTLSQQDFTRTFSSLASESHVSPFNIVPSAVSTDSYEGFSSEAFENGRLSSPIAERTRIPGEISRIETFSRGSIEFEDSDCSDQSMRK